ncbi:MAG TPA: hypothetical protein VGX76_22025, partial [Pirellulales bacterium]|nr:hypothetical protein [Pirellulales bacterium]
MTLLLAQIDVSMLAGNPMLSRLGAALVHFLWQGAAGTALALVLLGLLKRSGPQLRYAVLVCVLATMAACPAVTFWRIASVARPDAPDSARSS